MMEKFTLSSLEVILITLVVIFFFILSLSLLSTIGELELALELEKDKYNRTQAWYFVQELKDGWDIQHLILMYVPFTQGNKYIFPDKSEAIIQDNKWYVHL